MNWCTIESDPGVFTALCEEVGVKGVQFEEVYTLGPEAFAALDVDNIYGLIFLFKWQQEADDRPTVEAADHGLFFAHQVIQNACATQAILSVLMNNSDRVDIGPHLRELREFTATLDAGMKGLTISNSDVIRTAHNSFRHQSSFEVVQDKDAEPDDAFHFVGYVGHEGKVYELDGLKKNPVLIGDVPPGTSWADKAREEIQRRVEGYSEKAGGGAELRFNLMAIVQDRLSEAKKAIDRERHIRQRANISLVSRGEDVTLEDEVDDDDAPADIPSFEDLCARDVAEVYELIKTCNAKIADLEATVAPEKLRREKWAKENKLRRTDLVPLALCAMRHLARLKQLVPAFEKGKAAHVKRVEEKKAATTAAA